jgi:hypothetical protein
MGRLRPRPRDGIVASIMRRTRASFHYAVRLVKNNSLDIIKNRFASTIIAHNDRDFWYEAKKVCGTRHEPVRTVDGLTQQDDIANLFARSYEDLYSRVGINESESSGWKVDIDTSILHDGFDDHCIVKVTDVITAVSKLKPGIHDGHASLTTEHVKLACNKWFIHLSMLLSALIIHGNITDDLLVTSIWPIPKGKNLNYSNSANYGGIALSSIVGKIFDFYILSRYERFLASSNLQFGYKVGHLTSMCTMILKEIIEHYRHQCKKLNQFLTVCKGHHNIG